jgi:hypothetical protein
MIAYSRGSNRLASGLHPAIAQLAEQQTCGLWAAGSNPAIQALCEKQPNPSDPGLAPAAALAR